MHIEYSSGTNEGGTVWLNLFLDRIDTSDRKWATSLADAVKAEAIEAVKSLAKEVASRGSNSHD